MTHSRAACTCGRRCQRHGNPETLSAAKADVLGTAAMHNYASWSTARRSRPGSPDVPCPTTSARCHRIWSARVSLPGNPAKHPGRHDNDPFVHRRRWPPLCSGRDTRTRPSRSPARSGRINWQEPWVRSRSATMTTSGTLIACHVIRSAQVEVGMPGRLIGHSTLDRRQGETSYARRLLAVRVGSALHIGDGRRAKCGVVCTQATPLPAHACSSHGGASPAAYRSR